MSDELDRALDEALSSYSAGPECVGLTERVRERVQARSRAASHRKYWWAGASLAAAAAGLLTWFAVPKRVVNEKPVAALVLEQPLHVERVLVLADMPRTKRHRRYAEPKLAEFPSPSPLTSEEKALLRLASYQKDHPKMKLPALGEPIKEIEIAAISIKPIGQEEKQ